MGKHVNTGNRMWKRHNKQQLLPNITKNRKKTTPKSVTPKLTGADKAYNLAKQFWNWPMMKAEIQPMIDNCDTCQIHQQQKTRCHAIPESTIADLLPHQQLNMDYGHHNGKNYLILADRATGYIFAHQTDNLTTQGVIQILENIINTFGTPDIIRCDNAGSFRKTFTEWAEKEGITINPVSYTHLTLPTN